MAGDFYYFQRKPWRGISCKDFQEGKTGVLHALTVGEKNKKKRTPRMFLCFMGMVLMGIGGPLSSLTAETVSGFTYSNARWAALGGSHATMADGFSTLFSNPAGFIASPEEWSAAEVSLSLYGPIFDILDLLTGYFGGSGSLDLSGIVGPQGLAAGGALTGPLSFGYVGKGLGFGFFNRVSLDAKTVGLSVAGSMTADILVVGGYSFRFVKVDAHTLDGGFLAKGFVRGSIPLSSSIFSVQDLFSGNIFASKPLDVLMGVGADLGLLYQYEQWVRLGITYHDVYSPALRNRYTSAQNFLEGNASLATDYVTIKPELDVGLSLSPSFPFLERYSTRVRFYMDYRDLLDLFLALIPRNPILNIGLGMEVTLLDVFQLRAGIADALPALGLGIDFSFMRFDLAMRGVELGLDPGVRPTYGVDLNLLFRY